MRHYRSMAGDNGAGYLSGLPAEQQTGLGRVNQRGLETLRTYLESGQVVAFLGAGASAPLYPLWDALITDLVDVAAGTGQLADPQEATCRAIASESPEEVVEIIRQHLGTTAYREVLREILRPRTDQDSGRSWTPVQELVCRCAFKAVVTTNYDPGIVDARMRVRPGVSATGFTTWQDELGLDEWRTGRVFGGVELPVLYAHGVHSQPDSVVLAASDYRRAYAGKLTGVLARLADGGHLCWIGFSFTDQRLAAILREVPLLSGTRAAPGAAPAHVAIMAWDPEGEGNDPGILAQRAEISYGARVILYPAPGGDHSALAALLTSFTDVQFPPAANLPSRAVPAATAPAPDVAACQRPVAAKWSPEPDPVSHFTGRAEELARLDRWAADPEVRLVGVTAWGGAGKTTLVTHWVHEDGVSRRLGLRGVFGWSFYTDPSAKHWAAALLKWARKDLNLRVRHTSRAGAVLALLRQAPMLLVLDGLEVLQEGPAGNRFGRLLNGTLREVLVGACQPGHTGLVVLTSRFPFADLESYDGGSARMLDIPPFTPAEGAALMAAAGGGWLPEQDRRSLVAAVDGHALAVAVLAGLLAAHLPGSDLEALRASLAEAVRTDIRVGRVLEFYAERLPDPDRYLLAAVSLFTRPVTAGEVLTVTRHKTFRDHLDGWTQAMVLEAVRDRLAGLTSCQPNGAISAHPLVRDTFRPLALGAARIAAKTSLTGVPKGTLTSRADALSVVEAIELLVDAGHWKSAHDLYTRRADKGRAWWTLPAARLGQRAATAFVATPDRRHDCATHLTRHAPAFYLDEAGTQAALAGDTATAREYLSLGIDYARDTKKKKRQAQCLWNLAACFEEYGQLDQARDAVMEYIALAKIVNNRGMISDGQAFLGSLAGLTGDATEAEQLFSAAAVTQSRIAHGQYGYRLYGVPGLCWAGWLARTGRPGPAQVLTSRNARICRRNGWSIHAARCDRELGELALATGDTTAAGEYLAAAAACFRNGDCLSDLAGTLPVQAEYAQAIGDLDTADRHLTETIDIAAPRGWIVDHATAMAVRARLRAARAAATASPDLIIQGRDAANAALRLATGHHLPWPELDAMRAHAALDQAEGSDHGWATKAKAQHARLVPPGLDHDPLATAKGRAAARKKSKKKSGRR